MHEETVHIPAGKATLQGTLFSPEGPPRGAVLLSAATAIPHGYYQHFARWLSETAGRAVLTYDYHDFGASRMGPMSRSEATMADWMIDDVEAARAWLLAKIPEGDLWMIGHSLGALGHAFHSNEPRLARAIAVASGPAHTREHPMPYRLWVKTFWHVIGPLSTALMGYLPGRRIGLGANIPAGVFWQWRRWCTTRGFFLADDDPRLATRRSLKCSLRTIALSDDKMIPPHVVRILGKWHPKAEHRHLTLDPANFDLGEVGHLEIFRRKNAALWPHIIA